METETFIDNQGIGNSTANQQSTTSDTVAIKEEGVVDPILVPFRFVSINTTGVQQTLKEFLAKPLRIDSFLFSDTPLLKTYDLESYLHTGIWGDKLRGFYGVRGTFRIKVQTSAQKFQQGMMLMTFQPMYSDMKYANGFYSGWDRTSNLTTATQLPHIEIPINNITSIEYCVPYSSICSHYNLITKQGSWGRVSIRDFVPLQYGQLSLPTVSVIIWLSLEEAEFAAPCDPDAIVTQFGSITTQFQNTEAEQKTGPVEVVLSKVSSVSTLASGIPLLSSIARPLAWVTNIGAKLCSTFGWSKPINTMAITRFNKTQNQYQNNCEGVSNAFNLGLTVTNSVSVLSNFGSNGVDEMSLAYIQSKSAYFSTFTWNEDQVQGVELFSFRVDPSVFYTTSQKTGSTDLLYHHTPISGLSNVFTFWHGSLVFRIKFVKTIFHVGKIMITFSVGSPSSPFGSNTRSYKTTIDGSQYLHREILDIEVDDEYEFTIPYVSMFPYSKVGQPIGRVQAFVLNQLRVPETASRVVTGLMFVKAGPDFEFAFPRQPRTFPACGRTGDPNGVPVQPNYSIDAPTVFSGWDLLPRNDVRVALMVNSGPVSLTFTGYGYNYRQYFNITLPASVTNASGATIILAYPESTLFYIFWLGSLNTTINSILSNSAGELFVVANDWEGTGQQLVLVETTYDQSSYTSNAKLWLLTTRVPPTTQMNLGTIGSASVTTGPGAELASVCIGEKILSVKQLISRALPVSNFSYLSPLLGNNLGQYPLVPSRPHGIYPNQTAGYTLSFSDYYSYFGACYAYSRGGAIIQLSCSGLSSDLVHLSAIENSSRTVVIPNQPQSRFRSVIFEKSNDGNQVSGYFPFYSPVVGRLNTKICEGDMGCSYPFSSSVASVVSYSAIGGTRTSIYPMRSGADDTQFGFFLGFPPMETFTPSSF